jgi:hypothetical protein
MTWRDYDSIYVVINQSLFDLVRLARSVLCQ